MKVVVDAAGRVLLPKALRESLGIVPGAELDVSLYGGGLQLQPGGRGGRLVEEDGALVIEGTGTFTDDDMYRLIDEMRR